ncbi:hypothetical protein ACH3XW_35850 [Acanthocheilonema viteae]
MLIRIEYFYILVLALPIATAEAPDLSCEDIVATDSGNVMYTQANYAVKHAPGTTALMICKFGYVSSFPFLVFCQKDGKWNDKLGECILTSKTCDPQNSQHNIIYIPPGTSTKYPSGTFAMLQCSMDQVPIGQSSAMCLDGKWTAELGVCKKLLNDNISNVIIIEPKAKSDNFIQSHSTAQLEITPDNTVGNYAEEKSVVINMASTNAENMTPTNAENMTPTNAENMAPTNAENMTPTNAENMTPTNAENMTPTNAENMTPTNAENMAPTSAENMAPTNAENMAPTNAENMAPTNAEHMAPTNAENMTPTNAENMKPTSAENMTPPNAENTTPPNAENMAPTSAENMTPTNAENMAPTDAENMTPTDAENMTPTNAENMIPTNAENMAPTNAENMTPTNAENMAPTSAENMAPTNAENMTPTNAENATSLDVFLNELDIASNMSLKSTTSLLQLIKMEKLDNESVKMTISSLLANDEGNEEDLVHS